MTDQPLPPEILDRCREMRQNATNAENLLWKLLRDRQFLGYKFRRQHPIAGYITDFYCREANLIIELDGAVHTESNQSAYDEERTKILESLGLKVLRFWNHQVLKETPAVLQAIASALQLPSPLGIA